MKNILKIIIKSLFLFLTVLLTLFSIYIIKLNNTLNINSNTFTFDESKKIYDRNHLEINSKEKRLNYIYLDEVSPYFIKALLATEDIHFYQEGAFNAKRIIKAVMNNIKHKSFKEGASTITQQLIKNQLLTTDKTLKRKLDELIYSIKVTNKYSKDQILEFYINTILMGQNIYGISEAANYYFNKSAKDLSISESALLAGMIQRPNYYNPFKHLDRAISRKNLVLKLMYQNHFITNDQYQNAINETLHLNNNNMIGSYLNPILEEIKNLNINSNKIETTFDLNLQYDLYQIVNDKSIFKDPNLKCSIFCMDSITGGVLGMVKNRSFTLKSIDYTKENIQVGSTIKPIIDFAPSFEYESLSPGYVIMDEKMTYPNGQSLKNYDSLYKGPITLREALSDSRNIPALKLYLSHKDKSMEFANNLNLNLDFTNDSVALGSAETNLRDLTNAYQAFSSLGVYKRYHIIKNYYIDNKKIDYPYEMHQAMKKTTAFLINSILHDVFKNKTYDLKNNYLMAKTGQTNYDLKTIKKYNLKENSTKDSLLIAYTKDITIGIYVGYDNARLGYLDLEKIRIPRIIMHKILSKYSQMQYDFEMPDELYLKKMSIKNNEAVLDEDGFYEYFYKSNPIKNKNDELYDII